MVYGMQTQKNFRTPASKIPSKAINDISDKLGSLGTSLELTSVEKEYLISCYKTHKKNKIDGDVHVKRDRDSWDNYGVNYHVQDCINNLVEKIKNMSEKDLSAFVNSDSRTVNIFKSSIDTYREFRY